MSKGKKIKSSSDPELWGVIVRKLRREHSDVSGNLQNSEMEITKESDGIITVAVTVPLTSGERKFVVEVQRAMCKIVKS